MSFSVGGTWKIGCWRQFILCLRKYWRQLGNSLVVFFFFFSFLDVANGPVNITLCSVTNMSLTPEGLERKQRTWWKMFFVLHFLARVFEPNLRCEISFWEWCLFVWKWGFLWTWIYYRKLGDTVETSVNTWKILDSNSNKFTGALFE